MKQKSLFITLISASALLFSCGGKKPSSNTFKITWDLGDQQIVEKYNKGETPHFDYVKYTLPIKNVGAINEDKTEQLADCFYDWDHPIVPVSENVTYKAVYKPRSLVTRVILDKPGSKIKLQCEKKPVLVNWGNATEEPTDSLIYHTYSSPLSQRIIYIFGDIGSISATDENGYLLESSNDFITQVFLSPYVNKIKSGAFAITYLEGLFVPYSIMNMEATIATTEKKSARASGLTIYVETPSNISTWDPTWNKSGPPEKVDAPLYVTFYNVYDVGISDDGSGARNVYITANIDGVEHIALVKNYGASGNYALPSTVVTNLGEKYFTDIVLSAFSGSTMTGISFKEDCRISYIGSNAFSSSSKLKSFTAPESLVEIGNSVFLSCAALEEVTLNNTIKYIGDGAFQNCNELTKISYEGETSNNNEVKLPSSVEVIDTHAFMYSDKLTKFIIPNSVKFLGDSAFRHSTYDNLTIDMTKFTDASTIPEVSQFFLHVDQKATIKHSNPVSVEDFTSRNWPANDGEKIKYQSV